MPKTARSAPSTLRSSHSILVAGEVGVDRQPGPLPHQRLLPRRPQLVAALGGAAVLPDQGAVDRLAARRVPGDHGLALVGDPDPVELGALDPGVGDRLGGDPPRHLPDLGGVVLDPARPREVLLELRVGAAGDPPLAVEDEAGRAGGPLVDREDHVGDYRSVPDLAAAGQGRGEGAAVGEAHRGAGEGEDGAGETGGRGAGGAEVAAPLAAVGEVAMQAEADALEVAVAVESRPAGSR